MQLIYQWLSISILYFSLLTLSSCQSTDSQLTHSNHRGALLKQDSKIPKKQLTFKGSNENAIFSATGKQIIYVSSQHKKHTNRQIYKMDLNSNKISRITYHDGENLSVFRSKRSHQIYYTSTTDEIKESTIYLDRVQARIQNKTLDPKSVSKSSTMTEIYKSNLDGSNVKRITNSRGYDGDITVHPQLGSLLFSSKRYGAHQIFSLKNSRSRARRFTKGSVSATQPRYSTNGKHLTWIEAGLDGKNFFLMLSNHRGQRKKIIFQSNNTIKDPTWNRASDTIIFSTDHGHVGNFEIYAMNLNELCLKRLTYHLASDTAPDISPDGKSLLFTSQRTGRSQIFIQPFTMPKSCKMLDT